MISGYIVGDKALVAHLAGIPAALKRNVDARVLRLGYGLQALVQSKYLRGPRPTRLGVKTGRLMRSITQGAADSRSRFESTALTAFAFVGTNVEYAARWEYGGTQKAYTIFPKTAKVLHFMVNGKDVFASHVNMPARKLEPRPFLAPALAEYKPTIIAELSATLKTTVEQALKP